MPGTITEYSTGLTASSGLRGLCLGPDGNVWACAFSTNKIVKITSSGTITEYAIPTGTGPYRICSDGTRLWATCNTNNYIISISTSGTITEYSLGAGKGPRGIVKGPDGNLWAAFQTASTVAKIVPSGASVSTVTEYATTTASAGPFGICSDGASLWVAENSVSKIAKVTTAGSVTEYATTTAASGPFDICYGPDGLVWFTEQNSGINKIGKITSGGTITEYATPSADPQGICSDGFNLWLVETSANKLALVTTAGSFTEYAIPTAASSTRFIAAGGDSRVWFGESSANKIGAATFDTRTAAFTVGASLLAQPATTWTVGANLIATTAVTKVSSGLYELDDCSLPYRFTRPNLNSTSVSGQFRIQQDSDTTVLTSKRQADEVREVGGYLHNATTVGQYQTVAVSVDVNPTGFNAYAGVVGLKKGDNTGDSYLLRVGAGAGTTSDVADVKSGVTTSRASTAKGIASAATKRVKLTRTKSGSTNVLNAVVDGTQLTPWTDSSPVSGDLDVWLGSPFAGLSVAITNFDNLCVCLGDAITVKGVPTGGSVRLYDSTDTVLAQGTESGGQVTLDCSAVPFPITGYLRVFTDTYTTQATNGRYPGWNGTTRTTVSNIYGGDLYQFNLTGYQVVATDIHNNYGTTESASHNGVVTNGDTIVGLTIGILGEIIAFRGSVSRGTFYTYTVQPAYTLSDQHMTCELAVDSQGYLHILYGGWNAGNHTYYQKSNAPWNIEDWGAQTNIGDGLRCALLCDQADKLHAIGIKTTSTLGDSIVYLSKASGGAWSGATTLANAATNWEFLLCDADVGKETPGQKSVNASFFAYNYVTGVYRDNFLYRSTDGGSTWRGLNAGSYTLPHTQDATTGVVSGVEKIYSGTGANVGRMCIASDNTTIHYAMIDNTAACSRYIKGTASGGWAAPSKNFTEALNNAGAIDVTSGQVVFIGTNTASNTLLRWRSSDAGSTWTGPETMFTGPSSPHAWFWPKLTPVIGQSYIKTIWQDRYTTYDSAGTAISGSGTASLFLADVQAVTAATFTTQASLIKRPIATFTLGAALVSGAGTSKTAAWTIGLSLRGSINRTFTIQAVLVASSAGGPARIVQNVYTASAQYGSTTVTSPQFGSSSVDVHDVTSIS